MSPPLRSLPGPPSIASQLRSNHPALFPSALTTLWHFLVQCCFRVWRQRPPSSERELQCSKAALPSLPSIHNSSGPSKTQLIFNKIFINRYVTQFFPHLLSQLLLKVYHWKTYSPEPYPKSDLLGRA